MSEEEKQKLKQEIISELIQDNIKESTRTFNSSQISKKYRDEMYKKFGSRGRIDDAIRTVAIYKCGTRYLSQIPCNKIEEFFNYMEKLYKDILNLAEYKREE